MIFDDKVHDHTSVRGNLKTFQYRSRKCDASVCVALNADALRVVRPAQQFVQEFNNAHKPIAFICHAPWLLVSAGLTKGRTVTSYHTIQDDLRNAGAKWVDKEAVRDSNWVSSRQPTDIPAFNREMISLFSEPKAKVRSAS